MYDIFFRHAGKRRQAIPVRLIPFATGWRLDPPRVAALCAGTEPRLPGGDEKIFLPSFQLLLTGKAFPLPARDWDSVHRDLLALARKLKARESVEDENLEAWRERSIETLPDSTFVWHDELVAVWKRLYPRLPANEGEQFDADEPYPAYEGRPGDYSLNPQCIVPKALRDTVFDGFEDRIAPQGKEAVSFLVARQMLSERWNAGDEEIAIWIWNDTLNAYCRRGKPNGRLVPFSFWELKGESDYKKRLLSLYFSRRDIEEFEPDVRYLTGDQVIERWKRFDEAEVVTEILRVHSGAGTEHLSMSLTPLYPLNIKDRPVGGCLFRIDQIEAFEPEYFPKTITPTKASDAPTYHQQESEHSNPTEMPETMALSALKKLFPLKSDRAWENALRRDNKLKNARRKNPDSPGKVYLSLPEVYQWLVSEGYYTPEGINKILHPESHRESPTPTRGWMLPLKQ